MNLRHPELSLEQVISNSKDPITFRARLLTSNPWIYKGMLLEEKPTPCDRWNLTHSDTIDELRNDPNH